MAVPNPTVNRHHEERTTFNDAIVVTPSDTVPVTGDTSAVFPLPGSVPLPSAYWIGVAGDITVTFANGRQDIKFSNYPVGWFPGSGIAYIMATGTTASSIVGVY